MGMCVDQAGKDCRLRKIDDVISGLRAGTCGGADAHDLVPLDLRSADSRAFCLTSRPAGALHNRWCESGAVGPARLRLKTNRQASAIAKTIRFINVSLLVI